MKLCIEEPKDVMLGSDEIKLFFVKGNPRKSRPSIIMLPPELNYMGLPYDFPEELLDEMPRDTDGAIMIDVNHPKVKHFIIEKNMAIFRTSQVMDGIRHRR